MQTRIMAIGVGIVAVATGSIVAATVTASSGGTTAAKPPAHAITPSVLGFSTSAAPTATGASSGAPTTAPSTAPSAPASPTPAVPSPTATTAVAARNGTITYVVKPGDNLSVISAWFHLHGYGALYDANRSVIGRDPNLIFPGERITISHGSLTTSMP